MGLAGSSRTSVFRPLSIGLSKRRARAPLFLTCRAGTATGRSICPDARRKGHRSRRRQPFGWRYVDPPVRHRRAGRKADLHARWRGVGVRRGSCASAQLACAGAAGSLPRQRHRRLRPHHRGLPGIGSRAQPDDGAAGLGGSIPQLQLGLHRGRRAREGSQGWHLELDIRDARRVGAARAPEPAAPPVQHYASARSAQTSQGCLIKGNRNRKGQWIYHLPGMPYYVPTRAEEWFCSEAEAQAAGYRRAIVRQ
jgi:hypothetical protein